MSRDRFTEKDENGKWMTEMLSHERLFYIHRCDRTDEIIKDYLYGPAIERLAAYEDLIFSPEVLQTIIKEWKEWADAKNDGRLVILPCKAGSEVFVLWFGSVVPATVIGFHFYEWREGYSVRVLFDTRKISGTRDLTFEAFGKTLFFTREEAEAALKGENK